MLERLLPLFLCHRLGPGSLGKTRDIPHCLPEQAFHQAKVPVTTVLGVTCHKEGKDDALMPPCQYMPHQVPHHGYIFVLPTAIDCMQMCMRLFHTIVLTKEREHWDFLWHLNYTGPGWRGSEENALVVRSQSYSACSLHSCRWREARWGCLEASLPLPLCRSPSRWTVLYWLSQGTLPLLLVLWLGSSTGLWLVALLIQMAPNTTSGMIWVRPCRCWLWLQQCSIAHKSSYCSSWSAKVSHWFSNAKVYILKAYSIGFSIVKNKVHHCSCVFSNFSEVHPTTEFGEDGNVQFFTWHPQKLLTDI